MGLKCGLFRRGHKTHVLDCGLIMMDGKHFWCSGGPLMKPSQVRQIKHTARAVQELFRLSKETKRKQSKQSKKRREEQQAEEETQGNTNGTLTHRQIVWHVALSFVSGLQRMLIRSPTALTPPKTELPDCVLSAHYRQHVQHINVFPKGVVFLRGAEGGSWCMQGPLFTQCHITYSTLSGNIDNINKSNNESYKYYRILKEIQG